MVSGTKMAIHPRPAVCIATSFWHLSRSVGIICKCNRIPFFDSRCTLAALEHHAAGADSYCFPPVRSWCWVPAHFGSRAIQIRRRTLFIPPTAETGAVSIFITVVVSVRRAELHPVWLPNRTVIIVESVTGVAMVPAHVQSVVVGLWFNGHTVVLGIQPLTSRRYLHFHAQTTT